MRLVVALAVGFALCAAPAGARADAVLDWSVISQGAILAPGPTAHASTLDFAMVHGAVYDAVNSIDRRGRSYLRVLPAHPRASKDAAVATAAFKVLAALYPAQLTTLQASYDASLAAIPFGLSKARGIAAGDAAAAAMLAARRNDGRLPHGAPYPFPQGTAPGEWRVSPPLTAVDPAWWVGNVKPFIIPSARLFRTQGPNPLWSRAYAKDLEEVKLVGAFDSTSRTEDQTTAAIFWQSPPIALYGSFMRELAARYRLSTAQNARLFSSVGFAIADAAIACWADKYDHRFWRPVDAIRLADTDGNPATTADPAWKPLFDPATQSTPPLATPNFPDHPSGHSCASSAAVHTIEDFFGTDRLEFDVTSTRYPGRPRHFTRFSQMLDEVIDARVWAGVHFRAADEQGAQLGEKVARWQRWFS